jgi:adenylate kinase
MIIIITGTPGTGKTEIAKALAKITNHTHLDVNRIIAKHNLKESYDKKRLTYVVDEKKLSNILIKLIKSNNNLIIDSHMSHYIPSKYIDLCIVTKTDLKELKKRLKKRNYPQSKIKENLEAEAFDICLIEALESKHKVIQLDTTKKTVKQSLNFLKNETCKN